MARLCSSLLLSLVIASSASAVTMDWTFVGDPGNACDPQEFGCFGAAGYSYNIGAYEVTNAQYTEFLNAKAASDPTGLYNTEMGNSANYGGITRSGGAGSYTYSASAGRQNMPVNFITFFDAARFANWLNNGQGSGDTESGAYTLLGGTATPINGTTVTRNPGANIFLPSEDEWYKAAYYDSQSASYFDFPTGSNTQPTCGIQANCGFPHDLTPVGSYTGSPSPYGTFDQGGNVFEWNETILGVCCRAVRGGSFASPQSTLAASYREGHTPSTGDFGYGLGFRLAMIPEPGTGLLVMSGLLGLAGWRRVSA